MEAIDFDFLSFHHHHQFFEATTKRTSDLKRFSVYFGRKISSAIKVINCE